MANQIQGTVYQVDTTMQIESISMAFSTQNIVVRASGMGSCISYYQSPGNIAIEYFVTESYGSLISAANVGEVALIQATIASSGQSFGFPSQNLSIQGVNGGIEGANACIQYRGVPYYVTETESELNAKANAGAYRVYTALLTQSGGDDFQTIYEGSTTIGVTYQIFEDSTPGTNYDFTSIGAPNNNIGTYFVATGTNPNWDNGNGVLRYNTGAPVVTVLENTIGNIWWSYMDLGYYSVNSNGLFTSPYAIFISNNTQDSNEPLQIVKTQIYDVDMSSIKTYGFGEIQSVSLPSDNILYNTPIEIRVYN